jgi:hypothetical protein
MPAFTPDHPAVIALKVAAATATQATAEAGDELAAAEQAAEQTKWELYLANERVAQIKTTIAEREADERAIADAIAFLTR